MPNLRAQSSVHDGPRTAYRALGARSCAENGSAAARPRPRQDDFAPADCGASVRNHKGLGGCDALPDGGTTQGSDRDGAQCARLQHETCNSDFWAADHCCRRCRRKRHLQRRRRVRTFVRHPDRTAKRMPGVLDLSMTDAMAGLGRGTSTSTKASWTTKSRSSRPRLPIRRRWHAPAEKLSDVQGVCAPLIV